MESSGPTTARRAAPRPLEKLLALAAHPLFGALALAPVVAFEACQAALGVADDGDVYWIAAAGRDLLRTGRVPRTNAFSFVDGAHPWVMHEWLYGPLYAAGLDAMGPAFFVLVSVLVGTLSALVYLQLTVGRSEAARRAPAALVAFFGLSLYGSGLFGARPTWSALLFPLAMTAIAFARRFYGGLVLGATLLELAWANAHGSFPLGLLLLASGAAAHRLARPRILALVLACSATLLNPYGLALHRLVLDYAAGAGGRLAPVAAHVREYLPVWQRFDPATVPGLAALASWAAVCVVRRRHAARAVTALLLIGQAVLHVRHTALAGLVGSALLLPSLEEAWASGPEAPPGPSSPRRRGLAIRIVAPGLALALVVFALRTQRPPPEGWRGSAGLGDSTARLLREVPDGARAFVPFPLAGIVMWGAADRGVRVFYDPRNDCYGTPTIELGMRFKDGLVSGEEVLSVFDRTGVEVALTPAEAGLVARFDGGSPWQRLAPVDRALASSPRWAVVAEDGAMRLYARR